MTSSIRSHDLDLTPWHRHWPRVAKIIPFDSDWTGSYSNQILYRHDLVTFIIFLSINASWLIIPGPRRLSPPPPPPTYNHGPTHSHLLKMDPYTRIHAHIHIYEPPDSPRNHLRHPSFLPNPQTVLRPLPLAYHLHPLSPSPSSTPHQRTPVIVIRSQPGYPRFSSGASGEEMVRHP